MNGVQRSSDGMSPDKGPLFPPPPPPMMMCIVSYIYTCTVEPQFDQRTGKIVHHHKVFKYPGSVFLKLLLLLGLGNSFVTPRPSICRGSSYLGSTLPGHYLLQASSIIINLSSSITGV